MESQKVVIVYSAIFNILQFSACEAAKNKILSSIKRGLVVYSETFNFFKIFNVEK